MKTRKAISFIASFLILSSILSGQDQVRIMDKSDESAGRFKTQLYHKIGSSEEKLRGNSPTVEANGKEVELILRLKDLRWFEDKNINESIKIRRSDIVINDPTNLQIASSPSQYEIGPVEGSQAEIRFKVLANGKYSLKIPFSTNQISGQYVQSFSVEGLSGTAKNSTPLGNIADLKKEWSDTDKTNASDVQKFINKYQNNQIALEENLIAIAERALLRIEKTNESGEDEEMWARISDSDDEDQFTAFLDQYPNSKYAEAARAKLGMEADVLITSETENRKAINTITKLVDNVYSMDLSHLEEVDIKISDPDAIEIFDTGGNIFDLKVSGSNVYTITVKEKSSGEELIFTLDNRFSADFNRTGGAFNFVLDGGVSPFTVEFLKKDEEVSTPEGRFENLKPNRANTIVITQKMLNKSGMAGDYGTVIIRDKTTQSLSSFPIDLNVSPSKISPGLLIGLLLAGVLLGGAFMIIRSKKQKQTRQEYLQKAKVFQETQKLEAMKESGIHQDKITPVANAKGSPKKITITKPVKKFVPANGGTGEYKSSGKMKITRREVKGGRLTGDEFREMLEGDRYAFLDLTELWNDSAIKELYLSKDCIKDLGKFLKEENLDKAIAEMEGAIPEVGGFLMGYHQQNDAGEIRVTMDEFVPFVPEYHDVFKIEIGTATLVQELGDAQDTHPDKDVIGWFHTHPGHGLFLSNSDLSVQRHFPQKFQIAMEIDSLTETLDTAFFTRKMDGTINNVEHRRKGAKWFSWKKIEKI
ncbi:MPN domain-containing protein [Portibacter marinus]|uniref:hypothetical protein n=1 Tax=Portibacter marinus TaxID=2898660 RepID=UPI001F18D33B|nr:hypothetical protein [Portibacter marinus]